MSDFSEAIKLVETMKHTVLLRKEQGGFPRAAVQILEYLIPEFDAAINRLRKAERNTTATTDEARDEMMMTPAEIAAMNSYVWKG